YFPVCKQYAVDLGLSKWDTVFLQKSWDEHAYEAAIFPPIPYSATTLDLKNTGFRSPFGSQSVKSLRWRHWLGTDQLGRDVAAGMVAGTRVALLVGIISMGIATLLGILLGSLAGFFGDDRMRASWTGIVLNLMALFLAWFYGFSARGFVLSEAAKNGGLGLALLTSLGIAAAIFLLANGLNFFIKKWAKPRRFPLPLDLVIMRAVEVMNAVPGLLLLLAMVAMLEKSSIFYVMAIIGLLRWTGVTRFLRAELLKVRGLGYVEAARAMGYGEWRILLRHALPNAIRPVLVVVAFGVASAILMESSLSFLGIGARGVTWGSLLAGARAQASAWWLAVFPGGAIFVAVTVLNLIGDGLSEAMTKR
ncbi:MAG: ABC transporter permease, partial [Saprospiraceae bacterium]|nr:ABC transporter permease [Saprospiraceae bacterium]